MVFVVTLFLLLTDPKLFDGFPLASKLCLFLLIASYCGTKVVTLMMLLLFHAEIEINYFRKLK